MFNSLAIVSLLTAAAFAQSSTSSASPLIPSEASQSCQVFLKSLDSDSTISSCLKPLMTVAQTYGPNGNASNATASSISSDIKSICSSTNSSCPENTFRTLLASFQSSCSKELTEVHDKAVIYLYDIIYAYQPFLSAVCSKDDNSGDYCVIKTSSLFNSTSEGSENSLLDIAKNYLWSSGTNALSKRADEAAPNATTFEATNILYLFRIPSLSYNQLCTSCTRNIVAAWVTSMSNVPYAPGFNDSVLLHNFNGLYEGIGSTCGPNFLSQSVSAAGGLSDGTLPSPKNGSFKTFAIDMQGIFALVFGIITTFIATAF